MRLLPGFLPMLMSLLAWITLFCVIGGVLSVVAAGTFLVLP
ncbi:MAG: hypothetical protein AABY83_01950 [Pseudomonadota bacterium]